MDIEKQKKILNILEWINLGISIGALIFSITVLILIAHGIIK